jgi:hypothetical protein
MPNAFGAIHDRLRNVWTGAIPAVAMAKPHEGFKVKLASYLIFLPFHWKT